MSFGSTGVFKVSQINNTTKKEVAKNKINTDGYSFYTISKAKQSINIF
jgi:hypothetical protein